MNAKSLSKLGWKRGRTYYLFSSSLFIVINVWITSLPIARVHSINVSGKFSLITTNIASFFTYILLLLLLLLLSSSSSLRKPGTLNYESEAGKNDLTKVLTIIVIRPEILVLKNTEK